MIYCHIYNSPGPTLDFRHTKNFCRTAIYTKYFCIFREFPSFQTEFLIFRSLLSLWLVSRLQMVHPIFHSGLTQSYRTDSYVNMFLRRPPAARGESSRFPAPSLTGSALFVFSELTVKTELYHVSHPLNSVDLSCFSFSCISGINNPLKCHQILWSPRELHPPSWRDWRVDIRH